jgi:prepilin-type N-terminal cleavage/methylation domain-containing protein
MKHSVLKKNNSRAFTMIELTFVIVVLGILASLAIPRLDRDYQQEAADAMLSHIRYTQHLALTDNKHMFDNRRWHQQFWRIVFSTCSGGDQYFMIGSDASMDGASNAFFAQDEAAIDPKDGKPYFWSNGADCSSGGDGTVSNSIFISKLYGISDVVASGGCQGGHLGFDNMGRPHYGFGTSTAPDYSSRITTPCTFTFELESGDNFAITIQPETGYAQIVGQEDA